MKTIKEVLIKRDHMSSEDAEALIDEAKEELQYRLENDEDAYDICKEFFGLEPDYLDELMY